MRLKETFILATYLCESDYAECLNVLKYISLIWRLGTWEAQECA